MARDRVPVFWIPGMEPTSKKLQPHVTDETVKERMKRKLEKARQQGYIAPGKVTSLI